MKVFNFANYAPCTSLLLFITAHVSAAIMGPSLVVPFEDRKLMLGQWQKIAMVDFDSRPRTRDLVIQMIGE